jgi:hypothetical protein
MSSLVQVVLWFTAYLGAVWFAGRPGEAQKTE